MYPLPYLFLECRLETLEYRNEVFVYEYYRTEEGKFLQCSSIVTLFIRIQGLHQVLLDVGLWHCFE
jgi:hypothetical protein